MRMLRATLSEVVHLFVDDGSLALALMVWCAVIGLAMALLPGIIPWSGLLLFLGCAVVLLANVVSAGWRRANANRPG